MIATVVVDSKCRQRLCTCNKTPASVSAVRTVWQTRTTLASNATGLVR